MKAQALLRNRSLISLAFAGALGVAAAPAAAQPAPPPHQQPPPGAPAAPPATTQPAAAPAAMAPQNADPIAQALAPKPGGLTAEEAAKIAARTKHSVRGKQEDLRAAAARVDQALVGFFPRLSLNATVERLSPVIPFSFGPFGLVATPYSSGTGAPIPVTTVPAGGVIPGSGTNGTPKTICPVTATAGCYGSLSGVAVNFPVPPNSYSLTASLSVPISDYVLRISQNYSAASHNEKAARLSVDAEALQAAADAKITYFNWVRAKGGVVVAAEAVEQSRAHLDDAKKAFNVGLASRADVLRIDAQLAAAQQSYAEAVGFNAVAEEQLRVVLSMPSDQRLEIGSDVMGVTAALPSETLQVLQEQAMSQRTEIRALDETIYSLKQVEAVTKAGYAPRLDGFADAVYANPNQRIFPATQTWTGTWDVGLRLSWTINDTFTTIGAAAEAKARVAGVNEQKGALRDGLRLEVASAYADSIKAPPTIEASDRGMVSAEESLRVRRELFRNGKATSSELVDAEAELTRARLRRLDAHVDQLVARARLDHATGRDVPAQPKAE